MKWPTFSWFNPGALPGHSTFSHDSARDDGSYGADRERARCDFFRGGAAHTDFFEETTSSAGSAP